MKTLRTYLSVWYLLTINSFSTWLSSRFAAALFLLGKILRFVSFIVFLYALFLRVERIADYTFRGAFFFFLTFTVVDTASQLFFRHVYQFRRLVVTGDFDLILVKPMNPLFRALLGGADPLDLFMLFAYMGFLVLLARGLGTATLRNSFFYLLLLANGFLIAAGFHILVLSLAVVTTEIDHAVMIYRDLTSMARVPVDIYREPLRSILTFVIPIGLMMTFPAKAMMGLLNPLWVLATCAFGTGFFILCKSVWNKALSHYASASS